jgi:DNA-directed RNA polymerase specialized sigma24 family protein
VDLERAVELPERLARLARTRDAATVATLSTELLEALRMLQTEVSRARDEALVDLNGQGMSMHEIARLAGLTRGRVFQIVQRALGSEGDGR